MPLESGSSQDIISNNIREMRAAGHPQSQSVAAALANARRYPRAFGGAAAENGLRLAHAHAQRFAEGGMMDPPPMPFGDRQALRSEYFPEGVLKSEVPGRTDHLPMAVAAGSYVIPADVVSGLGEGNTLAGAGILSKMFNIGPYGMKQPHGGGRNTIPHAPGEFHFAHGGWARKGKPGESVPIDAAGGEFIIPPDVVKNHPKLGNGSLARGHDILDAWVKHRRDKTIKTMQKLPGPAK